MRWSGTSIIVTAVTLSVAQIENQQAIYIAISFDNSSEIALRITTVRIKLAVRSPAELEHVRIWIGRQRPRSWLIGKVDRPRMILEFAGHGIKVELTLAAQVNNLTDTQRFRKVPGVPLFNVAYYVLGLR